jgi:hypothetical protein
MQKQETIKIMEGCGNRLSYRNVFKKLKILPLTSQYLLHSLMFVVQNENLFLTSMEYHNTDTRQRNNSYLPQTNLNIYQKGAYYSGIKIFNHLPREIQNVSDNLKKYETALEQFLYTYSFHTLEEYFNQS